MALTEHDDHGRQTPIEVATEKLARRARAMGEALLGEEFANKTAIANDVLRRSGDSKGTSTVLTWLAWDRDAPDLRSPSRGDPRARALLALVRERLGDKRANELERLWKARRDLGKAHHKEGTRAAKRPEGTHPDLHTRRRDELARLCRVVAPVLALDLIADFDGLGSDLTDGLPLYVSREADVSLAERLDTADAAEATEWRARLVVVAGPPKSGKTRSMLECLQGSPWQGRDALVLSVNATLESLARALDRYEYLYSGSLERHRVVVVIDDLQDRLSWPDPEMLGKLLEEVLERPLRPLVVASVHDSWLAFTDAQARMRRFDPHDRDLLLLCAGVYYEAELTTDEEAAAQVAFAGIDLSEDDRRDLRRLPEILASVPALLARVEAARRSTDHVLRAFCAAVLDAAAIAPTGCERSLLRILTERHVEVDTPNFAPLEDEAFRQTFDWGRSPIGRERAVVNRVPGTSDTWKLFDVLADTLLPDWAISPCVDAALDRSGLLFAGVFEYDQDRADRAMGLFARAAEMGDAGAMVNFGFLLERQDRLEEAEKWFRKAADTFHTDAMFRLGCLLERQERLEEAARWYRKAARFGHTDAMVNLAALLRNQDHIQAAEKHYRQEAEAGDTDAMVNLAILLEDLNGAEEAEMWFRKAADAGDTDAMCLLADLLDRQWNRRAEVEEWWRRAASRGNADGMINLGVRLRIERRVDEAEMWFQKAVDAGRTDAMILLGLLLQDQDRLDEAETLYRRATDAGDSEARDYLRAFLENQGRFEEAEGWRRRVDEGTGEDPPID